MLYVNTFKLPSGTVFVLHIQNSHLHIDLRTLNPCQIIAIICQNADGCVHVEHHPLINQSTMMAAATATGGGDNGSGDNDNDNDNSGNGGGGDTAAMATTSHRWQWAQTHSIIK